MVVSSASKDLSTRTLIFSHSIEMISYLLTWMQTVLWSSLERLVLSLQFMSGMLHQRKRLVSSIFKLGLVASLHVVFHLVEDTLPLLISLTTIEWASTILKDKRIFWPLMDPQIESLMSLGRSAQMIYASPLSLQSKLSSGILLM